MGEVMLAVVCWLSWASVWGLNTVYFVSIIKYIVIYFIFLNKRKRPFKREKIRNFMLGFLGFLPVQL